MATKYILAALAIVFLGFALTAVPRGATGQARTWTLIAIIFGVVSLYLFSL
jgi:hypothetical protein